jgi:hypothetical protein
MQLGRSASAAAWWGGHGKWRSLTLPDITIWTAPGQHHEIKHKSPTASGLFGLEVYRFDALLAFANETQQAVYYTIHNHALAGGRDVKRNILAHWCTANVRDLVGRQAFTRPGSTYISGVRKDNIDIHYWPVALWQPLKILFAQEESTP